MRLLAVAFARAMRHGTPPKGGTRWRMRGCPYPRCCAHVVDSASKRGVLFKLSCNELHSSGPSRVLSLREFLSRFDPEP